MMRQLRSTTTRLASRKARARRPEAESLEGRMLLYAAYSPTAWTYSSRITYSFMPDGTSIGGVPSSLSQTMNAIAPTATWQNQIEQAASLWESSANLNVAQVPDSGDPAGVPGNQQDDPRFGDIRIGAVPLGAGVFAETFLPPPSNGGTIAGDILFNSNVTFGINGGIDLETAAAHELGHALGLGESTDPNAVMYGTYDGIKDSLDSDDIAGIQSIYGAPQYDAFNSGGQRNNLFLTPTNLNTYLNGNNQVLLTGLDNTLGSQSEWYAVTVPASTSGTMTVTVQSSNLSSLAPQMTLYRGLPLVSIAQLSAPTTYGATLSYTMSVSPGQKYYIQVKAAGGYGAVGGYGLEVNLGSQPQGPVPPPNTVVLQQPDGPSGGTTDALMAPAASQGTLTPTPGVPTPSRGTPTAIRQASVTASLNAVLSQIGDLSGWAGQLLAPAATAPPSTAPAPVLLGLLSPPSPVGGPILQSVDQALSHWIGVIPTSPGSADSTDSFFKTS